MDLEEQIRQVNNPQEFVKLCNTIFTLKYNEDFQIIDGSRSDKGNDGYVRSEERLFAIYCPVKPENKRDQDFISKIQNDLKKAKELHDNGDYSIKRWTFVTPGRLSNNVIVKLIKKAEEYNIDGNHIEATTLANELYSHPGLIQKFPWLHLPKIESDIAEVKELIKSKVISGDSKKQTPSNLEEEHDKSYEPTDDFEEVSKIITNRQEEDSKSRLKGIYYKTTDKVAQANAILGILKWLDVASDNIDEMLELCEEGLNISDALDDKALRAILLGRKGFLISYKFSELDMITAYRIKIANIFGVSDMSDEELQEIKKKLSDLQNSYKSVFEEAIEISRELNRPDLMARVLIEVGNSAGIRFIHFNGLNIQDRANFEKALSKRALMSAKDIYSAISDKLGVGYATHALASQLFTFGENNESKMLNTEVTKIAEEFNDLSLLQVSKWLEENLITGKVPDYAKGERRELKI